MVLAVSRSFGPLPTGVMEYSRKTVFSVRDGTLHLIWELTSAEAYIGMIREANHCIYIENQFCKLSRA